jgi:cytochrome c oxidase subunit 1
VSSIGAFIFGFSQVLFLYVIIHGIRNGVKAEGRPWSGARGLEWTLPSPAPYHSFTEPPVVSDDNAHG